LKKVNDTKLKCHFKKIYKISKKDYDELCKKQAYRCKICGELPSKGKRLCVDHDHSIGKVRGLLCHKCNTGLGMFQDSATIMRKAIKYLNLPIERPKAIAIDLDDCVLNFLHVLLRLHNEIHKTAYRPRDMRKWVLPEDVAQTFKDYEEYLYASLSKKPGVEEALKRIRAKNYKIVFITARNEKFREATEFNLKRLGIEFDELFFNSRKALKLNRLSELFDICAFIDDKVETVEAVREKTDIPNIYLVRMPSNSGAVLSEGVIRINNLHEIKEVE